MYSEPDPGTVIAGRFILEHRVGYGGMGTVFRARDRANDQSVALKLMHPSADTEPVRRLVREAELLAELRHPGIVTYVAHGATEDGQPFLAMEWLEGEELAQRLARQPLSLQEALLLLRRVAEALATAHRRGIIHRDLKPSNLFLRSGRLEQVVVLDFGLARHVLGSQQMTASTTVLGTPAYMAPEQASSQPDLSPRADIFSLGCVLYECLTGQQPFSAPHFAATLAKILFAEPPPLRSLRPELPSSLQGLLEHMLAKEPSQRLPHAMALLESLARLELLLEVTGSPPQAPAEGLAGAEQRLVSVLLVHAPAEAPAAPSAELLSWLSRTFSSHGARVAALAEGSLAMTFLPERGAASDQAVLAARCALSVAERWPQSASVLSTGRAMLGQQLPVGEVMDRAGQLLRQLEQLPASSTPHVLLEEVTAGLLGSAFVLDRAAPGLFLLRGEHVDADASRLLLGRPTPCVGREQELSHLELAFATCAEDASAQAVLVVAPAGMGKSRLRHEFLRRLERQGREVLILQGRGDPMKSGSAYGLLGQAVRRLCGMVSGEEPEALREKLRQRAGRHLPLAEALASTEFLGELCGLHFPDADSPRLRAARTDPRVMSAQVGRAFISLLQAECARAPVLLVLEDLHWGDSRSVALVDEALRALAEHPFMVLALARPEVKEQLPGLWGHRLQEIPLRGLGRRAGARLVREVLGPEVPEPTIERMVEQAAGNALFLEELIRRVAEGQGEAPPATVLAMLQGRIQRLEPGARRVLLAASFFGRCFWPGGVRALLHHAYTPQELEQWLRRLMELEVVELQPTSHFPSEVEYRFRHVLVRDAAYGLVPDSHKPEGHRLAGAWLEQQGEPEPLVLAEHYQLSQERERAIPFYIRAAEQLYARGEWREMVRCVEGGQACGASGETLTLLQALHAAMAVYRVADYGQGYVWGRDSLAELKPGSIAWCMLAGPTLSNAFNSGQQEEVARLARSILDTRPEPDAAAAYTDALLFPLNVASVRGERQAAAAVLGRMGEVGAPLAERELLVRARLDYTQAFFLHYFEDRVWQTFTQAERASGPFRELGQDQRLPLAQVLAASALAAMGSFAEAGELLQEALAFCHRGAVLRLSSHVKTYMALALAWSPEQAQREQARELALGLLQEQAHSGLMFGRMRVALAKVAVEQGELHEAEAQARGACELLAPYPPFLLLARTVLSASLLGQGRPAEAREQARLGVLELERMGGAGFASVRARLALAEACLAMGDTAAGESALRRALQSLRTRAEDIPDPERRQLLLHRVPENVRVLQLAHPESPPPLREGEGSTTAVPRGLRMLPRPLGEGGG